MYLLLLQSSIILANPARTAGDTGSIHATTSTRALFLRTEAHDMIIRFMD